jgi:hypothetical protein
VWHGGSNGSCQESSAKLPPCFGKLLTLLLYRPQGVDPGRKFFFVELLRVSVASREYVEILRSLESITQPCRA